MWCHHIPAGTPLETRSCQITAPWASSKPLTFTQVHKCQLISDYGVRYQSHLPRVCPLLKTVELAWRLLPRWLPGCLAQRAVSQMVKGRARRSEGEELVFFCHRHPQSLLEQQNSPKFLLFLFYKILLSDKLHVVLSPEISCAIWLSPLPVSHSPGSYAVLQLLVIHFLYFHHGARQQKLINLKNTAQNSFRGRSHVEVFTSRCLVLQSGIKWWMCSSRSVFI